MQDKRKPLKFHPLANLFPHLEEVEYESLKAGIAANAHPIVIYLLDRKILDGRNRYRACRELGIEPEFREFDGPGSPLEFVLTMNMNRRHLTSSQRAAVAVDVEDFLLKEGKQRRRGSSRGSGKKATKPEKFPEMGEGEAREKAAKIVGTNAHYVTDAKKIKKEDPDLFEELRSGAKTMQQAKRTRAAVRKAKRATAQPADSEATAKGSPTDGATASTTYGHGTTPPDDAGTRGASDPTPDGHSTTSPDDAGTEPTADDAPVAHEGVESLSVHDVVELLDLVASLAPRITDLLQILEDQHSSPHKTAAVQALQKLTIKQRLYYSDCLVKVKLGTVKLFIALYP